MKRHTWPEHHEPSICAACGGDRTLHGWCKPRAFIVQVVTQRGRIYSGERHNRELVADAVEVALRKLGRLAFDDAEARRAKS